MASATPGRWQRRPARPRPRGICAWTVAARGRQASADPPHRISPPRHWPLPPARCRPVRCAAAPGRTARAPRRAGAAAAPAPARNVRRPPVRRRAGPVAPAPPRTAGNPARTTSPAAPARAGAHWRAHARTAPGHPRANSTAPSRTARTTPPALRWGSRILPPCSLDVLTRETGAQCIAAPLRACRLHGAQGRAAVPGDAGNSSSICCANGP